MEVLAKTSSLNQTPWTLDGTTQAQHSRFCEVCSNFDLYNLAWNQKWRPGDDWHDQKIQLGAVSDIRQNSTACDFCRLLTIKLAEASAARLARSASLEDSLRISPCEYATIKYLNPQGSFIAISYLVVEVVPVQFQGHLGPALPPCFYTEGSEPPKAPVDHQPWDLLTIQPCAEPIPTVENFCDDIDGDRASCETTKFSGRLRANQTDQRLACRWLHLCQKFHSHLCEPQRDIEVVHGMKVVDVVDLCIVDAPESCAYLALSYCWGNGQNFVCKRENLELLSLPGALKSADLLNTIQDAITVTQATQIRYLWVDALCITQDDPDMLQSQIPHMDAIYGSAVFTIVAASGDNASSGLSGVQDGSRQVSTEIIRLSGLNLIVCPPEFDTIGVHGSAWRSRAWTMQEEIFSTRKLFYTPNRMVWTCGGDYWTEHELREPSFQSECIAKAPRVDLNEPRLPEPTRIHEYEFDAYRRLLEAYSLRHLGFL